MLLLIERGLTREAAYDLVQPLAMRSWQEERPFKALVLSSAAIMSHVSAEDIEQALDVTAHTRHVDSLFERAGLT